MRTVHRGSHEDSSADAGPVALWVAGQVEGGLRWHDRVSSVTRRGSAWPKRSRGGTGCAACRAATWNITSSSCCAPSWNFDLPPSNPDGRRIDRRNKAAA